MKDRKEQLRCGLAVAAAVFSVLSIMFSALGIIGFAAISLICAGGTMATWGIVKFML